MDRELDLQKAYDERTVGARADSARRDEDVLTELGKELLGQTLQQLMVSYSDARGASGVVWHAFLADARLFNKEFTAADAVAIVEAEADSSLVGEEERFLRILSSVAQWRYPQLGEGRAIRQLLVSNIMPLSKVSQSLVSIRPPGPVAHYQVWEHWFLRSFHS